VIELMWQCSRATTRDGGKSPHVGLWTVAQQFDLSQRCNLKMVGKCQTDARAARSSPLARSGMLLRITRRCISGWLFRARMDWAQRRLGDSALVRQVM
jgi:hypothetical protein